MANIRNTLSTTGKDDTEDVQQISRLPSPPPHTTHVSRGLHPPSFSAFQPRDIKINSIHPISHVSWSCDGRKLASVGIDKSIRVWTPEKSLETRTASQYLNGHEYEVDYVTWNPAHPDLFCSSSQRDRRIVFWDARQSRHIQYYSHNLSPTQINYSPDGKSLAFVTVNHQLWFMEYGLKIGESKEQWSLIKRDPVPASTVMFNHTGDGLVLSHFRSNTLMIMDYPSLTLREQPAAHVGGCMAVALDPRGRYLASGGYDSIINLFDMTEWICSNTVTACDYSINALSFSYDGEYLAIASQGSYLDLCATETALPIHRVLIPGPAMHVSWHPSKYVVAYCGQSRSRENTPSVAFFSLFGPGM